MQLRDHKLSNQALKDFWEVARGTGLTGAIWRGREAVDPRSPQAHRMCRNLDAVREMESVAGDVDGEVCVECSFREDCAYRIQKRLVGVDFWIVAHQSMYINPPDQIMDAGVAALIIDESFWQAGLAGFDEDLLVPLDALDLGAMPVSPEDDGFLSGMRQALLRKVKDQPDGPIDVACFRNSPLFCASCHAAAREEWARHIDEGTIAERAPNKSIRPMVALWEVIAEIPLKGDRSYRSGRLSLERDTATGVRQIRVRTRKPVNGHWCAPTLIIDATLEVDLVLPYFPKVGVVTKIAVRSPYQTIIQATDRAFGKSHFRRKDGEGGIAFHEPSAAAGVFPEIWTSTFAAQKAFQRARSWTSPCKEPNTRQCPPPRLLRFRQTGAGKKEATAAFDPRDIPFPRDLIEDRLGPVASIIRQWPMPNGLPPIEFQTIADLPRAERDPHVRHIDINRAYSCLLMTERDTVLRQDAIAFVMRFQTDCIEGGWTASDLFGAADGKGPPGVTFAASVLVQRNTAFQSRAMSVTCQPR